jgi:hypothetical protein
MRDRPERNQKLCRGEIERKEKIDRKKTEEL